MCWENINTEQRERKIYSRLIYIHELSSITKEITKQDESVFKSFQMFLFITPSGVRTFSASCGHGNNTQDTQEHILWQQ